MNGQQKTVILILLSIAALELGLVDRARRAIMAAIGQPVMSGTQEGPGLPVAPPRPALPLLPSPGGIV